MKKIFVRIAAGVIVSATLLGTIGCANTPAETTAPTTAATTTSTTAATTTAATTPAETTTEIEISSAEETTPAETTTEIATETTTKRDLSGVQEQYTELTLHFTSADVYASAQNGAVAEGTVTASAGYLSTDFVDISAYHGISYELAATRALGSVVFFDANKTYLSSIGTEADSYTAVINGAVEIPENAVYVKFLTFTGASTAEAFVHPIVRGYTAKEDYDIHVEKRAMYGTKIVCIGDGITEGDYSGKNKVTLSLHYRNYPYFLQQALGAEVVNYGKKDATAKTALDAYKSGVMNVKDADIILIMLGTNKGLEGDMGAAYEELLDLIAKDKKTDATIVLLTPTHATSDNKKTGKGNDAIVTKAAEIVRATATARSLAVIDVWKDSPIQTATENNYQSHDGLHLTEAGHRVLAEFLLEKMADLSLVPAEVVPVTVTEETVYDDIELLFTTWKLIASKNNTSAAEGAEVTKGGCFSTDFIDISAYYGIAYELSAYRTHYSIAFFDENKAFVSGIGSNSETLADTMNGAVIIPENAKYAKFVTFAGDSIHEAFDRAYVHGYKDEASYNAYIATRPYHGVKIACIGDSLTEGDYGGKSSGTMNIHTRSWSYFMQNELGCDMQNYGKCGASASSLLSTYKSGKLDVSDADIILLWVGSNGGLSGEHGSAYKELVGLLENDKKEGAVIVLVVPPNRDPSSGSVENVKSAQATVQELNKMKGYRMVDLFADSDVQVEMLSIYQPHDGVHLSEAGYHEIADFITESIRDLLDAAKK